MNDEKISEHPAASRFSVANPDQLHDAIEKSSSTFQLHRDAGLTLEERAEAINANNPQVSLTRGKLRAIFERKKIRYKVI